ncbi:MAG: phosphoribosyltransferase [Phycisphaeraceae bacterium]
MVHVPFYDRRQAGQALAESLQEYAFRSDVVVLGLPRGGVPVAYEIAQALRTPLGILLVRKLGVPGHEELAMGAVATGNARVLNQQVIEHLGIDQSTIEQVTEREQQELKRREALYRGDRPPPTLNERCVILVDDGVATGATMSVAIQALRQHQPSEVVVAVPVAPPDTAARLAKEADHAVILAQPESFGGVGQWYEDFTPTSDDEVRDLLARSAPNLAHLTREPRPHPEGPAT